MSEAGETSSGLHSDRFGPNVYIFGPQSEEMQETISRIYAAQRKKSSEFNEARYAILLKPGHYNLDVRVGYYTQISGLGGTPDDVTVTGAVRTQDDPATNPKWEGPGATNIFWRSVENLSVIPTLGSLTTDKPSAVVNGASGIPLNQNVWAVSQGCPIRRLHIKRSPIVLSAIECRNANAYSRRANDPWMRNCPTTLRLFDLGWASGGFMADSKIDGLVEAGTQQQWFSRNSIWQRWNGDIWNMVFLGSTPLPAGGWPGINGEPGAITDGGRTPIIREKPFLTVHDDGRYYVTLPKLKVDSASVDWEGAAATPGEIPIEDFYIVKSETQGVGISTDVTPINSALREGKHLLFTPGVYYLSETIHVVQPNTVILGLGLPTLVANKGQCAMSVSDVDGVSLAGLIFEAGPLNSDTLLEVGETRSCRDHSSNPTVLYDVFCRVGGSSHIGRATSCVTINSNDVIGDNLWLWRADHGSNVGWTENPADHGLIVYGDRVTMYGLAVEHFQKYQTVWNGNLGRVYFYQSEMPYDPPSQDAWTNHGANHPEGYASYKVGDAVTQHHAWGLGVYCYFRDAPVTAYHAIEVPQVVVSDLQHIVTFWLDGRKGSSIAYIINDSGSAVTTNNRKATTP